MNDVCRDPSLIRTCSNQDIQLNLEIMETNLIIISIFFGVWAIISTYWDIKLRKNIDALKIEKTYIIERGNILIESLEKRIKEEEQINRQFNLRRIGYESKIELLQNEAKSIV